MIICTPPFPVDGAPNLSKGQKVFDAVSVATDTVIQAPNNINQIAEDLKEISWPSHITNILEARKSNGYGDMNSAKNEHSLQSCGIIRQAAIMAVANKQAVFAPVSGFHHAGTNFSHGYCTFNGLILAAEAIRKNNPAAQVLIVDGDGHFGDGTEDFCESRGWINNLSLSYDSASGSADVAMLKMVAALKSKKWDLVIYQAGADSHWGDPYQVGYLSDREWEERDFSLFTICKELAIPLVFNLAGGYNGPKTLELHCSTVKTYRQIFENGV